MAKVQTDKLHKFQAELLEIRRKRVQEFAALIRRIVADAIPLDIMVMSELEAIAVQRYLDDIGVRGDTNPRVVVVAWWEADLAVPGRIRIPFHLLR